MLNAISIYLIFMVVFRFSIVGLVVTIFFEGLYPLHLHSFKFIYLHSFI